MKYVWIVTRANEGCTEATVLSHHETETAACAAQKLMPYGGYEGPVPAHMYPIGKSIKVEDYPV